jgi:asparagine synthase (glutamine-hydrolysing)
MCGIGGVYWSDARRAPHGIAVDRMLGALAHRGPDSDGRTTTQFADVGFKRLSIIDLESGDQPLTNEDGTIECYLNGEIYNYAALRKDLVARGHRLHTFSDTEVLPHLYEDFGEGMFAHLNGMFCVCLIDHRSRRLLLARDHFGVKQLYYARTREGLVFASEVKGVLASGLVEPEIDETNLVPYLGLFYAPAPETLVTGVRKLSPGSFLRIQSADDVEEVQYYEVPTARPQDSLMPSDAADRAAALLTESVRLQLHADVPVGISLSGGVDSSAIAAMAMSSRGSAEGLVALTIGWPDTVPEEIDCARQLCRQLGIAHEVLELEMDTLDPDLPLLAWISDEPVADPATYSQYRVALEASSRVKVLLGGAGGDELFGGYGHYHLPWKKAMYASLPPAWQRLLYRLAARRWVDEASAHALSTYRSSRRLWHRRSTTNLQADDEARLGRLLTASGSLARNLDRLFDTHRGYDAVSQQMAVDLQSYLPEQLLPMMDRATMAASIEGRVPFLDVPLVEFCLSLPGRTKLGWPHVQKRLLKRALSGRVPDEILRRSKAGMPSHFPSFMTHHPGIVRELLLGPHSYTGRTFPIDWLRSLVSSDAHMRQNFPILYALIVLEVWHRLFIEERIYTRPTMSLADLFRLPRKIMAATD